MKQQATPVLSIQNMKEEEYKLSGDHTCRYLVSNDTLRDSCLLHICVPSTHSENLQTVSW